MSRAHLYGINFEVPLIKENKSVIQYWDEQGGELDFQKLLGKFPGLPWEKYPGEKHWPGEPFLGAQTYAQKGGPRIDGNDNPRPDSISVDDISPAARILQR